MPELYDELCDDSMRKTQAHACCLVVIEGSEGTGAALKIAAGNFRESAGLLAQLPAQLRQMADDIEDGKHAPAN